MEKQQPLSEPTDVRPDLTCPMCSTVKITTSWQDHTFTYGSGKTAIELVVHIPVRRCASCEFDYLDHVAERLKHEAICKHFGVLTPGEVRQIRKDHQMTRSRFAEVTGIGEASLNRWENGINIQTHANDRYLRLLADPRNLKHLEKLVELGPISQLVTVIPIAARFPTLNITERLRDESNSFQLHKKAA